MKSGDPAAVDLGQRVVHAVDDQRSQPDRALPAMCQRPRMSRSASSTALSSSASRRPAGRPRRWGSTAVVCSTRTRVWSPSIRTGGRNVAGAALVDVGATSVVLRPSNSSACTTTAYLAPRCSCPRAPRRWGSLRTSPRTISTHSRWGQLVHLGTDDAHLLAVSIVQPQSAHLLTNRRPNPPPSRRFSQRCPHRFRIPPGTSTQNAPKARVA